MPLPDLCIAPHEAGDLSPDELLCAPATFRVQVWQDWRLRTYIGREVEIVSKQPCVAVKSLKLNSPTLFCNPNHIIRFGSTGYFRGALTLEQVVKQRFHKLDWRRFIYLDYELKLVSQAEKWTFCVELWKNKKAFWEVKADVISAAGFNFTDSSWRFTASASQMESLIKRDLANPTSDCAFAWRWVQLNELERSELAFPVQYETREQCDFLLCSIVRSDPQLDPTVDWAWNIALGTKEQMKLGHWTSNDTELESQNVSHPLSPRHARLLEIVVLQFGLYLNEAIEEYTVITQWRQYGFGDVLNIKVPIPTQHERLEARLCLRDWLQGKVAPEEIPFLLGDAA